MASIYRVRDDFDKKIERAGLSKAELARRADVSKYTLQKKTSGEIPRTRGAIAWRVARAYANQRGITDEQAMLELFEEVTDNTTPALAVA
jgi:hypothetical protein